MEAFFWRGQAATTAKRVVGVGRDGVKRMVLKTPLSPTHIIDST